MSSNICLAVVCIAAIASIVLVMRRRRRRERTTEQKIQSLYALGRSITPAHLSDVENAEREAIRLEAIKLVKMILNFRLVVEIGSDAVADLRFPIEPEDLVALQKIRSDYAKTLDFAQAALFEQVWNRFSHNRLHVYSRHCVWAYSQSVSRVSNLLEFRFPELVSALEAHL